MEKYQGLLLERLEGLAESHADEEQAETQPGDPQGSGQQDAAVRFDAAIRGIWRRLDDKKNLMDGVQSHEITRLRTTVRKRQTELTAATRERNELTGRVDDLQGKLQEREASLGERERENAELTSELAAIRKEKERLETTVAGLQLRIRRLRSGRGLRGLRLRARAAVDRRLGPGLRGHVVTTALILIGCACGIALALLVQRSLSDPPQTLPAVPPPAVQLPATGD
jgi:chromosome segregation ATPase